MSRAIFLIVAAAASLCLANTAQAQDADTPLWESVAQKHGFDAWNNISNVEFTWTFVPAKKSRSYVWDRKKRQVDVTMDGKTYSIPTSGKGLSGAELDAHKAFINDSYWLAFEFKAITDDVEREEMKDADSPFGGTSPAYRITYPDKGGYTPGDAYVVHVGADGRAVGWSYYPGGAKIPKMSTLRGGLKTSKGVTLPTRFEKPDGTLLIEITDLKLQ